MRGEVLGLEGGEGVIAGEDGNRYRFAGADLRRQRVVIGGRVDFVADGESARDIYPLTGGVPGAAISILQAAATPAPASAYVAPRNRSLLAYFFRAATDDYANFHGRARRKEFWGFSLFYLLFLVLIGALLGIGLATSNFTTVALSPLLFVGAGLLSMYLVGMIVPSLALWVRRLHDIGRSGWWLLLHFVPGPGNLILLVMALIGGNRAPNRWGPPTR